MRPWAHTGAGWKLHSAGEGHSHPQEGRSSALFLLQGWSPEDRDRRLTVRCSADGAWSLGKSPNHPPGPSHSMQKLLGQEAGLFKGPI